MKKQQFDALLAAPLPLELKVSRNNSLWSIIASLIWLGIGIHRIKNYYSPPSFYTQTTQFDLYFSMFIILGCLFLLVRSTREWHCTKKDSLVITDEGFTIKQSNSETSYQWKNVGEFTAGFSFKNCGYSAIFNDNDGGEHQLAESYQLNNDQLAAVLNQWRTRLA